MIAGMATPTATCGMKHDIIAFQRLRRSLVLTNSAIGLAKNTPTPEFQRMKKNETMNGAGPSPPTPSRIDSTNGVGSFPVHQQIGAMSPHAPFASRSALNSTSSL